MTCLPKSRNNFPKRKLWISLTPSPQLIPGTALPSRSALFPAAISLRKNPLRQAKRRLAVGLKGFADAVFPLHTGGNSLAGGCQPNPVFEAQVEDDSFFRRRMDRIPRTSPRPARSAILPLSCMPSECRDSRNLPSLPHGFRTASG